MLSYVFFLLIGGGIVVFVVVRFIWVWDFGVRVLIVFEDFELLYM